MPLTLTIRASDARRLLLPVLPHVSTLKADPPFLRRVRVRTDDTHWYATATDRYTLAVQRVPHQDTVDPGLDVCIDGKALTRAMRAVPKAQARRHDAVDLTFTDDEARTTEKSGPWAYPATAGILHSKPRPLGATPRAINPMLIARLNVAIGHNGGEPVLVAEAHAGSFMLATVGDDFVAAVGPKWVPMDVMLPDTSWVPA